MKAVSFLPAATQMMYEMGLEGYLQGITFECPTVAHHLPKIVRCIFEGKDYSSAEIDRIFSSYKREGKSLYWVEQELLEQTQTDVIFTQDLCEVCNIDTQCTSAAVAKLSKQPQLVPLSPNNLNDVFDAAYTIGRVLGEETKALLYLASQKAIIDRVLTTLRENNMPLKRVMLMEWIEPIYNCGHWIPFQIAQAGGVDMLSNPAGDSIVTEWQKIVKYDPEVLVIAPCGFSKERTLEELHLLTSKPTWQHLTAVKNKQVFIADFDMFTQPSVGTLVKGIEALACMFHPSIFSPSDEIKDKYFNLYDTVNVVR
ncbi:ABC transporter substrate-binding protein [Nubsella zeaxanthinifaciens]|jgi:iron complex transport system substrate-binding protein|uniref:ABC transporter substrate-binding protein n=1 Tax=Nubsella zeaxanthinifaciens TaxID=392412 RepID=UPI000DE21684|nr:ABC transporter substrate-binding protein [Nubsella zeaxanthinifaciens]